MERAIKQGNGFIVYSKNSKGKDIVYTFQQCILGLQYLRAKTKEIKASEAKKNENDFIYDADVEPIINLLLENSQLATQNKINDLYDL